MVKFSEILGRYNQLQLGFDELKDRRHQHQGRETKLSEIDQPEHMASTIRATRRWKFI
ncbi:MAG: hypothetical protein MK289_00855 [Trichodesmium sp. ALOHA_ZT_67]|uniref:hypothetical protein n=1 Tax=Trichodesmium erythraeum TaxID=1206 RepID=UPI00003C9E29|nr:hypothetical protein [Trichodesmium erythraeum GBRTRLIN201]MCH2047090.1 hypothetical protein [Trichodesmium sp. ALOHA_ZT_67]